VSVVAAAPADEAAEPRPTERRISTRWLVLGLACLLALPIVVGAIAVRRPTWSPVLDLAMTEFRLRDVGTSHTPLIGLPGRIGTLAEQGSHPGPLSFYVLAVPYRLLGSSAWAMQAGTALLDIAAMSVSLWLASRRGGRGLVIGVAVLLALLALGYGIGPLLEPWNPFLPMLWWFVVLLAVWSVLDGDLVALPIAIAAGSFCAQTHLPYLGLAGGLGVLVAGALVVRARRAEHDERRRILVWSAASVGLGVLVWLPPMIDQAVNDPGNMSLLADQLGTPPEAPVGLARGIELGLVHLDVLGFLEEGSGGATGSLVDASSDPDGSIVPGVLTLGVWALAAAWAVVHRHTQPSLARLHLVVGVALGLGIVSMSRIFGKVWYYLMLWAWGTAALLLLAVGWTIAAALASRPISPRRHDTVRRGAAVGAFALLGVVVAVFIGQAVDVPAPSPTESRILGELVPDTAAALERGEGDAVGPDGTYLVDWADAYYFGSQGYGLLSELERRGFDARAPAIRDVPFTEHRVLDSPTEADATVFLATGAFIEDVRALPGVVEVAFVDPRDAEERAEFDRLHAEVVADLEDAGLDDLVPVVDRNLFGVSIDERVGAATQRAMARMLELGQPAAVFIAPPGTIL